jgi:hypothetical protein
VTMKGKGALCLLALLLFCAGSIFTWSLNRSTAPAAVALYSRSAHSFLSAQPLTLPLTAESAPGLLEASLATQPHSALLQNYLSMHHLSGEGSSQALFPLRQNAQLSAYALLLPVLARTLGLSPLVLRE